MIVNKKNESVDSTNPMIGCVIGGSRRWYFICSFKYAICMHVQLFIFKNTKRNNFLPTLFPDATEKKKKIQNQACVYLCCRRFGI